MSRDFRIPRLYKTLLALAVVIGPIYWLMFTADGQRRTDLALMFLLGRPGFDAALESFDPSLTESKLRESFPALELQCSDAPSPLGDRLCVAVIGSFNAYPAKAVSLFFRGDTLSGVKVLYQRAYHDEIRAWVERRVARLDPLAAPPSPEVSDGVASWRLPGGTFVLKDGDLARADEPALVWLGR
jgi:hypothetical protein